MELLLFLGCVIVFLVSWIIWAIIAIAVSVLLSGVLYFAFEIIMALTFNNLINAVAKAPGCLGRFLGFIFALPFGAFALGLSIWSTIQGEFIALRIFYGGKTPGEEFLQSYVIPMEGEWPGCMFLVRFFVNQYQCIWGGSSFMFAYFPFQNGVMLPLENDPLPVPMMIIKLFFLGVPYVILFLIPLIFVVRAITWSFIGAVGRLPAISGNGTGQD